MTCFYIFLFQSCCINDCLVLFNKLHITVWNTIVLCPLEDGIVKYFYLLVCKCFPEECSLEIVHFQLYLNISLCSSLTAQGMNVVFFSSDINHLSDLLVVTKCLGRKHHNITSWKTNVRIFDLISFALLLVISKRDLRLFNCH